jgi:hypothetical protein
MNYPASFHRRSQYATSAAYSEGAVARNIVKPYFNQPRQLVLNCDLKSPQDWLVRWFLRND